MLSKDSWNFEKREEDNFQDEVDSNIWSLRDKPIDYTITKSIFNPFSGGSSDIVARDPRLVSIRNFLSGYKTDSLCRLQSLPSLISCPYVEEESIGKDVLEIGQGKRVILSESSRPSLVDIRPDYYIYNGSREELNDRVFIIESTLGKNVFIKDIKTGSLFGVPLEDLEYIKAETITGRSINSRQDMERMTLGIQSKLLGAKEDRSKKERHKALEILKDLGYL